MISDLPFDFIDESDQGNLLLNQLKISNFGSFQANT